MPGACTPEIAKGDYAKLHNHSLTLCFFVREIIVGFHWLCKIRSKMNQQKEQTVLLVNLFVCLPVRKVKREEKALPRPRIELRASHY